MASDLSSFASLQLIDSTESSNTSSSDTSGRSDGDSSSATNRSGHGRLAHRSGLLPETPRNGNPGKRRRRTSTVSSTHIDQTLTAMQSPAASESSSTFRSAPIVGSQSIAAAVATPGSVSSSSSAFPFSPDLSQSQATVATTPSNDVGPAWSQPIQNSQSSSRSIGVASVHSAQGTLPGACKACGRTDHKRNRTRSAQCIRQGHLRDLEASLILRPRLTLRGASYRRVSDFGCPQSLT
mmetsp:Transcript_5045/g.12936  ORF Transcript_5045/g.12936 Transcript_5045/m.12936 type:complete len:238 (-) Transcript_5045:297-1010(-)